MGRGLVPGRRCFPGPLPPGMELCLCEGEAELARENGGRKYPSRSPEKSGADVGPSAG